MRLYLSGPMTGHPDLNFPMFHAAAARLRGAGFEVVNPAEINPEPNFGWTQCMRNDLKQLVDCDGVAVLPGWHQSRGAQLEVHVAEALGITCRPVEAFVLGPLEEVEVRPAAILEEIPQPVDAKGSRPTAVELSTELRALLERHVGRPADLENVLYETVRWADRAGIARVDLEAAQLAAEHMVELLAEHRLVLNVEQVPVQPLAMGNYESRVSVRPARARS